MDAHNRITTLLDAPESPLTLSSPQASLLLRLYLTDGASLLDICDQAGCSLEQLNTWAESEWARSRFALIRKLAAQRDELLLADAVPQARQTLVHLATIADPAESASSRESRRKSALAIIRHDPDAPPTPSLPLSVSPSLAPPSPSSPLHPAYYPLQAGGLSPHTRAGTTWESAGDVLSATLRDDVPPQYGRPRPPSQTSGRALETPETTSPPMPLRIGGIRSPNTLSRINNQPRMNNRNGKNRDRTNRPPQNGSHANHAKPAPAPKREAQEPMTFTTSTPTGSFSSLPLAPQLLRAIQDEGYTIPTPIQAQAIPPALNGRDVLGCAQTGTGKTAAFALPILHRLHTEGVADERGRRLPRALILCPTRELAGQITGSFNAYGRHTRLRHTAIYGGVSQIHQERALHRGVDILVATPGRLIDLLDQGIVDLSEINTLVLDEADRMLDMGFIQPIRRIASHIPEDRQTLFFSATMPREIVSLADSLLSDPVRVTVSPVASAAPLIEQSVYMVGRHQKQALLHHLIGEHEIERTLVFTRTKHGADKVARRLNRAGINADAIHGNKSQNQRQRALDGFRAGKSRVLVATDVAARGLDIDDISHVFNFDIPHEPEAYIHRIGRTGRAGAAGAAIAFCDHEERSLLRDIERLTGKKIDAVSDLPKLPDLAAAEARADANAGSGDKPSASQGPRSDSGQYPRARKPQARRQPNPYGQPEGGKTARSNPANPHAPKPRNFAGPNARRGNGPAANTQGAGQRQGRGAAPKRSAHG